MLTEFLKYSLIFLKGLWAPNGRGVVFVGQWNEPFRLGLKFCSNRRWGAELKSFNSYNSSLEILIQ